MNSSTSSSEAGHARRWVRRFLATFLCGVALAYAVLILVDPYDSGRFVTLGLTGVSDTNLRTSDVSRGRDPGFDSAVFGSSTGQSVDPRVLSGGTGLRFTQLSMTGAGPRETLALLGWFSSRHATVRAVVLGLDIEWCSADPVLPLHDPFPFWLYGSDSDYLANVLNWKSFDRAAWRISLALGRRVANDRVGYFPFSFAGQDGFIARPPHPPALGARDDPFPWIERLARSLGRLPSGAAVVLLLPPVADSFLPLPGSEADFRVAACKGALSRLVSLRGGSLVDDRVDSPVARDTANFYDRVHYRAPVARSIEAELLLALRNGPIASAGQAVASHAPVTEEPHDAARR